MESGNIFFAPSGVFFWDAGQQIVLELTWMAKNLHPELFPDVNMEKEIKNFYARFYDYELSEEQVQAIMTHQLPEMMEDPNPKQ